MDDLYKNHNDFFTKIYPDTILTGHEISKLDQNDVMYRLSVITAYEKKNPGTIQRYRDIDDNYVIVCRMLEDEGAAECVFVDYFDDDHLSVVLPSGAVFNSDGQFYTFKQIMDAETHGEDNIKIETIVDIDATLVEVYMRINHEQ